MTIESWITEAAREIIEKVPSMPELWQQEKAVASIIAAQAEAHVQRLLMFVQHQPDCEIVDCAGGVVDRDTPEERPTVCTCGLDAALRSPTEEP